MAYPFLTAVLLLLASNVFMAFAWYGHLKALGTVGLSAGRAMLGGAFYFIFRGA